MNNYEYIIACMPVLDQEESRVRALDADAVIDEIRERLDESNRGVLDFMLKGYDSESLVPDFYRSALTHRSRFIREWFGFDLDLRNAKVHYLNKALGRAADRDVMVLGEEEREFDSLDEAQAILSGEDILSRERGLDEMMWAKAEALTQMEVFSLDAILGFVAKMKIVDRWVKLDPDTGREMFRKLVNDIRNNR